MKVISARARAEPEEKKVRVQKRGMRKKGFHEKWEARE